MNDEIVLLAKTKSNTIEVLIFRALTDFILVNKVLRQYDDMKDEIKNLKTSTVETIRQNNIILLFEIQKKYIKSKPESCKAKQGKPMLLSKWALCDSKKWSFVKQ